MRALLSCLVVCVAAPLVRADEPATFSPDQLEFFEKQVRPLLVERCHKCHGTDKQKGNLRLDSRAALLTGGDSGPAIDVDHLNRSELLLAISYDPGGYQMPPDGKIPDAEIAILTKWVELGAPWPAGAASQSTDPARDWAEKFDERRKHWSFQPLVRHAVPSVKESDWCRTPIDRFILSRLEETGLPRAEKADRRTWLRRVTLDVTGLPPTPAEIEAFDGDAAAGAHERVIDRLLASPHLGERWGRHWLDLVRYAESRGHEFDYDVANPWPYRDYVIRALNADVPYDRFVVEHVAGDLLGKVESGELRVESEVGQGSDAANHSAVRAASQSTTHDSPLTTHSPSTRNSPLSTHPLRHDPATGANESIVATGFWYLGEWVHSPVDIRQEEADRFENMIDVYSKSFLGLTVACARCHDHKFDPIPQSDFYALQGYLQSTSYHQVRYEHWRNNHQIARQLRRLERQAADSLLPVFADMAEPTVERLDQYLLAAYDVLRPESALAGDEAERVRQAASERNLDADRLESWCTHLRKAAEDGQDPYHAWGLFATGKLADIPAMLVKLNADSPDMVARNELSDWLDDARDENRLFTADQFQGDGIGFRHCTDGSARVDLGSAPERPLLRIEVAEHVEYDPILGELPVRSATMQEGGRLGGLERGGRTLRSPSFEITQNRLWCEIRGGCQTYVVVDSHALINGPLHGSLLADHPTPEQQPEAWRWVSHDVARYRGHRAHLEFVPKRGQAFAVRQTVMADALPKGASDSHPSIPTLADFPEVPARETVAAAYGEHWRMVNCAEWFVTPDSGACSCTLHAAEWVRQHPELFGLDSDNARRRFAEVARPLIERRNELLSQLERESGLAPVMLDGSGEDEYVFIRGNWKKRGETVPRRFLSAFSGQPSAVSSAGLDGSPASPTVLSTLSTQPSTPSGSGRLELAQQMIDPEQTPIVARVIVNRIWQHYFGRGIVPTPDDLGHLGTPPTHPELLDWLSMELVAHDWSLKHIHRLILESSTYRMGSQLRVESGESRDNADSDAGKQSTADSQLSTPHSQLDPNNTLLWRMNVKRMEGEVIRDSILSLSGRLDDEMYGRSIPVHLTSFLEGRGRPGESGPVDGLGRRSLYIAVRRNFAEPFFQAFDFPNPHSTIGRRNVSNVPAQALALMNNPMVIEQCRVASDRLLRETTGQPVGARIERLYRLVYGRSPQTEELAQGNRFIAGQAESLGAGVEDPRVWSEYAHVLLNAKEFVFVR